MGNHKSIKLQFVSLRFNVFPHHHQGIKKIISNYIGEKKIRQRCGNK